jgi:mRNA-degrading endonuclease RelE of RelBE toxin-antitoxin system
MPRKQTFLTAVWSEQWKASYLELSSDRQAACDEAAISLIKQASSPGLRIKPIHPEKYYFEARINSGDRIVFRIEEGTIFFTDVVKHDGIDRYGKRRKG